MDLYPIADTYRARFSTALLPIGASVWYLDSSWINLRRGRTLRYTFPR